MEIKEGSAVGFKQKKSKETSPDIKFDFNIGGKIYELTVWEKKSKAGNDYYSGQVKEKVKKDEVQF